MPLFIVDANLSYYFALWNNTDFIHLRDIDETWSDALVWKYARENNLIIISKDADFSSRMLISAPPPRVIHLRIGGMRIGEMHAFLYRNWPEIGVLSKEHKLVSVYPDRIEAI